MGYLKGSDRLSLIIIKCLIVNLTLNIVSGIPQSPCLDVFEYDYDDDDNLIGLIQISVLNDNFNTIRLDVEISVGNSVGDFNGDIELLNPLSEVAEDLSQNRPLVYKLFFPVWSEMPPKVTQILVNGEEICYGDPVENSLAWSITTVNIGHSLTLPKTQKPRRRPKAKRPLSIAIPKSHSETSTTPSQESTRPSTDLSNMFPSNPFFNSNYKHDFNTNSFSNNQNIIETNSYGSTARPETYTNTDLQYQSNFQDNHFLYNYNAQNAPATYKPQFSNTQQNYIEKNTEPYMPNFQNNPFLSGYANNQISSTSNQPESSNSIFQNSPYNPHFGPHHNFPQTTQQPTTTTRRPTRKRTSRTTTTTGRPTRRSTPQTTSTTRRPTRNSTPQITTTTRRPTRKSTPQATTTTRRSTRKQTPVVEVKDGVSTTTSRPIQKRTTPGVNIAQRPKPFASECGISVNPNMLVMNGNLISKVMHPWLAAVFLQNNEGLKFICGSTLISRKHVITAAHCVRDNRRKFKPEELWIILGRENIRMWSNDGAQTIQAESTHIHPDYKIKSADADIAVIVLAEEAIFSNLIRPVCLWTDDIDVRSIIAKSGTVVGWGKDEFGNLVTAEPRAVEFPVVSEEDCLWSNAAFREITSNRTFCAGHRNNSGPCNGDSGGGFLMEVNKRWTLRGVVSMSLLRESDGTCDLEQYVVFTDAAQFLGWLMSFLK